jgi:hypothetical protein
MFLHSFNKNMGKLTTIFYFIQSFYWPRSSNNFYIFILADQANSIALYIFKILFIATALLAAWIVENNNTKVHQNSNNNST